jgi:hypothetical protein
VGSGLEGESILPRLENADFASQVLVNDRSLSEAARRKMLNKGVWSGPGRFGPSRKKEAAARRFGGYELWVLNAAMIRTRLLDGRMR